MWSKSLPIKQQINSSWDYIESSSSFSFFVNIICFLLFNCHNNRIFFQKVNNPYTVKVKDGKNIIEYKENDVDDTALHSIIEQAYAIFKVMSFLLSLPLQFFIITELWSRQSISQCLMFLLLLLPLVGWFSITCVALLWIVSLCYFEFLWNVPQTKIGGLLSSLPWVCTVWSNGSVQHTGR